MTGEPKPATHRRRSTSGAAKPNNDALQVYVRMYRALGVDAGYKGMLGDCFLIRLVEGGRAAHILIDCGMLLGSDEAVERMKRIAGDIVHETGGTDTEPGILDLLVVTHEHWDHISGFSQAQDILLNPKRLRIANLWMAWTEKDGDPQVARLRARFDKAGFALTALAGRIEQNGMQGVDKGRTIRSLQGFLGAAEAGAKRLQGRDIMAALKEKAENRAFLEPGTVLPTPVAAADGPSLRAYVLGPPREETFLFKDKPSSGPAQETYFGAAALSDMILRAAGNDDYDRDAEKDGSSRAAGSPFAQQYCTIEADGLAKAVAAGEPLDGDAAWIADRYYRLPADSSARAEMLKRRWIDDDWLSAAGPLALKLDSDTNNTSLALAFDLPDGSAMLFAADAQVGNWLSWHERSYRDETGAVHSAEQILNRTRFYKVGHHGSHNATLDAKGLAMMTRDDLVAAIPTDEEFGAQQGGGWQMPNPRVKKALMERTRGRILRNDRHYSEAARAQDEELKHVEPGFFAKLAETELYLEYRVL